MQSSLQPVATGCGLLQRAVVCCNGLWSVVSGSHCVAIIAATGCNGLWSFATACCMVSADCTVLQSSLQPVATGCSPLQIAVVCCNGRHTAATGRHALQPVVLRCCGTRDRCCENVVCAALSSRQQVAPGLWSVATGYAQLQHGTALQQIALACITVVVRFSQQVRLRHSKWHCVATGTSTCRTVAMRCNKWSVDLFCNIIVRCCNMRRCNRLHSRATVLGCRTERCCNSRCAVATDGKSCWLRRCTTMPSAAATRDTPLQRIGNSVGCVVA